MIIKSMDFLLFIKNIVYIKSKYIFNQLKKKKEQWVKILVTFIKFYSYKIGFWFYFKLRF